jgi:hypothetical protein
VPIRIAVKSSIFAPVPAKEGSALRHQTSFALVVAMLGGAGCSGKSSGSMSGDSESDGAPTQQTDDENDGAVSSSTTDAAGTSDAHTTGDAKSTMATSSADAGDAPAGQAGANVYCAAICDREAACLNVTPDASTCHCNPGTLTLYRNDYVAKLAACESAASCGDLLSTDGSAADSGLDVCAESALAQITPTGAVTAFCSQLGLSTCPNDSVPDCPDTFKVYSDGSISALATCIADPNCNDHAACVTTALTP